MTRKIFNWFHGTLIIVWFIITILVFVSHETFTSDFPKSFVQYIHSEGSLGIIGLIIVAVLTTINLGVIDYLGCWRKVARVRDILFISFLSIGSMVGTSFMSSSLYSTRIQYITLSNSKEFLMTLDEIGKLDQKIEALKMSLIGGIKK